MWRWVATPIRIENLIMLILPCIAGPRPEHHAAGSAVHQVDANGPGHRHLGPERPNRCADEVHISGIRDPLGGLQWPPAAVAWEGLRQGRSGLHCPRAVRHKSRLEEISTAKGGHRVTTPTVPCPINRFIRIAEHLINTGLEHWTPHPYLRDLPRPSWNPLLFLRRNTNDVFQIRF